MQAICLINLSEICSCFLRYFYKPFILYYFRKIKNLTPPVPQYPQIGIPRPGSECPERSRYLHRMLLRYHGTHPDSPGQTGCCCKRQPDAPKHRWSGSYRSHKDSWGTGQNNLPPAFRSDSFAAVS